MAAYVRCLLLPVFLSLFAVVASGTTPAYVYFDWAQKGGCQVQTVMWLSTTKVQCSYPSAQIDVYTDVNGTIHDTIYSDSSGTSLTNPFTANSDGSVLFWSNTPLVYVKYTGGGLPTPYLHALSGTSVSGQYLTQSAADARYLQLSGGTLTSPGNLTVNGSLTSAGILTANSGFAATASSGITANTPRNLSVAGTGEQDLAIQSFDSNTLNAVWLMLGKGIGIPAPTVDWRIGMTGSGSNDLVVVDEISGRIPLRIALSNGLITVGNGLTSTGGTTTLGTTSTGALSATSVASSGAISGTTGTFSSLLTAQAGLTVSGGTTTTGATNTGALSATTGTFSGALTPTSTMTVTGLGTFNGGLTSTVGTTTLGTTNAGTLTATSCCGSNPISGTTGTFSSNVSGVNATFTGTGAITGNTTLSGTLGVGQAAGVPRAIIGAGSTSTNAEELRIDAGSGSGGDAVLGYYRNSVNKGKMGVAGATNDIITGSAANDLSILNSQKINWSANGSAAVQMSLNTSGFLGLGSATAAFPLHVQSTTTPQIVAEYDATHRSGLWHSNSTGYVGTTTSTPFNIRTNNTDALDFDTSQNANFQAAVGLNDNSGSYPFSIKKTGTALLSGVQAVAAFFEPTSADGVYLGYNGSDGVVAGPNFPGSALSLWTRFGASYAKSFSVQGTTASFAGKIVSYNTVTLASNSLGTSYGLPFISGAVNLLTQSASIGTTNIAVPFPANPVRTKICWSQTITQAATSSSSLLTTIGWTNRAGIAKTSTYWQDYAAGTSGTTADTSNTLGAERGNCYYVTTDGVANVTYATTYATSGATVMQYALGITVEVLQ